MRSRTKQANRLIYTLNLQTRLDDPAHQISPGFPCRDTYDDPAPLDRIFHVQEMGL